MNYLGIDFGTKNIGTAIAIKGIISPHQTLTNDSKIFQNLQNIITEYQINQIYVGLSMGYMAELTKKFIKELSNYTTLPIETVDESVSTIESLEFPISKKDHRSQKIDSISAAIILSRALL
jgi:putative transcription antitermination factor YqgF